MRVHLACPPEGILAFVFGIQSNSSLSRAHALAVLGEFYVSLGLNRPKGKDYWGFCHANCLHMTSCLSGGSS